MVSRRSLVEQYLASLPRGGTSDDTEMMTGPPESPASARADADPDVALTVA